MLRCSDVQCWFFFVCFGFAARFQTKLYTATRWIWFGLVPAVTPSRAAFYLSQFISVVVWSPQNLKATLLFRPRTFRTSYRTLRWPTSRTRPLLETPTLYTEIYVSEIKLQSNAPLCRVTVLWREDPSLGSINSIWLVHSLAWCTIAPQALYMNRTCLREAM